MKYAVTAATGNFGQLAVKYLSQLTSSKDIVVIARNREKAEKLFPNFEIRIGDYDKQTSITKVLQGIDRVLFISSQPGGKVDRKVQHQNVVNAIQANHVNFVAYTSFAHAQSSPTPLAQDHKLTEDMITKTNIAHSFLRNNWYLENEAGFFASAKEAQKAVYWADNCAGWALESEYAQAAANVLTSSEPREVYEFTGKPITYQELGQATSEALGKKCSILQVSREDYIADLENKGLDHSTATLYASFQEPIASGSLNETSSDLPLVLGHPLTDLSTAIKKIVL